jgi:hypothetical protein
MPIIEAHASSLPPGGEKERAGVALGHSRAVRPRGGFTPPLPPSRPVPPTLPPSPHSVAKLRGGAARVGWGTPDLHLRARPWVARPAAATGEGGGGGSVSVRPRGMLQTNSLSSLKRQQSGPGAPDRADATQRAGARARAVAGRQTLPGGVLGLDGCRDWRRREVVALCWLAGAGAGAGAGAATAPRARTRLGGGDAARGDGYAEAAEDKIELHFHLKRRAMSALRRTRRCPGNRGGAYPKPPNTQERGTPSHGRGGEGGKSTFH